MKQLIGSLIVLAAGHLASAQPGIPDTTSERGYVYRYIDGIKIRVDSTKASYITEVNALTTTYDFSKLNSSIIQIRRKEDESSPQQNTAGLPVGNQPETASATPGAFKLELNPAGESMEILLVDEAFTGGEVTVSSSSGNVLLTSEMKEKRALIDVSKLPAGIYNVSIEKNGKISIETLVIR